MDLLYGIRILAVDYNVLSRCTRVTDRQTDRHISTERPRAFAR